jgi:DNA sulfur modification protein DndE
MANKLDRIRLPQQTKDQLSRLKRITGMDQWNMICRWGFCMSIADPNHPPKQEVPSDSNIEMEWETFTGEHSDLYWGLLLLRAHEENTPRRKDSLLQLLRTHITRGISTLTARKDIKDITKLMRLAVPE